MKVNRRELSVLSQYIDVGNPKRELNFLYIDKKSIVSTNTRALSIFTHYQKVNVPFYIARDLVLKALKEKKADHYILSSNKITCMNVEKQEILTFTIENQLIKELQLRFPDYSRILEKGKFQKTIPFTDASQITGILVAHDTQISPKLVTKDISSGFININGAELPIMIKDEELDLVVIIMPRVDDRLKELVSQLDNK